MRFVLLLSLLVPTGVAVGSDVPDEALDEVLRAMLVDLATRGGAEDRSRFPTDAVHRESETFEAFGMVLAPAYDRSVESRGLLVLGVTPGSEAARMGLRGGDRLCRVNETRLLGLGRTREGHARAWERYQAVTRELADGGAVELEVDRDGRRVVLAGNYRRLSLPAVTVRFHGATAGADVPPGAGCATLRFDRPTPEEFDVFPVELTRVNGRQGGVLLRESHYLAPGTYVLTLTETIPASRLAPLVRREPGDDSAELVLQVHDRMVYDLGARLLEPRESQRRGTPYWEPIVWQSRPGECQGRPVQR